MLKKIYNYYKYHHNHKYLKIMEQKETSVSYDNVSIYLPVYILVPLFFMFLVSCIIIQCIKQKREAIENNAENTNENENNEENYLPKYTEHPEEEELPPEYFER